MQRTAAAIGNFSPRIGDFQSPLTFSIYSGLFRFVLSSPLHTSHACHHLLRLPSHSLLHDTYKTQSPNHNG